MAKAFGYGQTTDIIGLPAGAESAGLVPDPAWLQQTKNAGWSPTDAANLAIGQGFFLATPLQVALVSASIGNNGVRMQPRLVTATAHGSVVVQSYNTKQVGTLPVSADHLAVIEAGMLESTTVAGGTSVDQFQGFPILVAGKTGTSESGSPVPNALFTCFAPASPLSGPHVVPKIAIADIIEHGGLGDANADPMVRNVLSQYFGT
jgi:penicillin-binding protein 2